MTTKVRREEILDNQSYEQERDAIRARVMKAKARRRVHLGESLTFLFENAETMRYQVQEMLRIEKRDAEDDVRHELETYNELLGDEGELGCTLLIEIEDEARRAELLRAWLDLPRHLFLELDDGSRSPAVYDERQVGDDRLSSVQYLRFAARAAAPVALVSTMPGLELRAELTPVQRKALNEDLGRAAAD